MTAKKIITEDDAAQTIASLRAFGHQLLSSLDKAAPLGNVYPFLETYREKIGALEYDHDFRQAMEVIDFLHAREYPDPGGRGKPPRGPSG